MGTMGIITYWVAEGIPSEQRERRNLRKGHDVKEIARVIVGSQLHGLATENSDVDYVSVIMSDPHTIFSPFYTERAKVQKDNVSTFELRHLLYLCSKGNPTALEVLWSLLNAVEPSWEWREVQDLRKRFLIRRPIFEAHRGYSLSQKKLKEGDNETRRVKARVAEYRILRQGIDILTTGDFDPSLSGQINAIRDYKNGHRENEALVDSIISTLSDVLPIAYEQSTLPDEFNRAWFDLWLYGLYNADLCY